MADSPSTEGNQPRTPPSTAFFNEIGQNQTLPPFRKADILTAGRAVGMDAAGFDLREDHLESASVRALLELHLAGMHASSPPGSVYALDLSSLRAPEVTVWTAWRGERVASVGALKTLGSYAAEVKSMRTHPDFLRQGAAAAILDQIIRAASERGVRHLSLETGSGPSFEAALLLYRRRGFVTGPALAGFEPTAFNQFLHMEL